MSYVAGLDSVVSFIGLLVAALARVLYWVSRDFRARKKREWRLKSKSAAYLDWGEWAFAWFMVGLFGVGFLVFGIVKN